MKLKEVLFVICWFSLWTGAFSRTLSLSSVFNDHMVLQREQRIRIWGKASENIKVSVYFNGQVQSSVSDEKGDWIVYLNPMKSGGSYNMKIVAGDEILDISDILIGDVFLAGGQSNMAFKVDLLSTGDKEELKRNANVSDIRYFEVARIVSGGKLLNAKDESWTICEPTSINNWSAIATYFALEIHRKTGVPVGIISCNHGDSPAGAWISPASFETNPALLKNCISQHVDSDIKKYYRNASSLYNSMLIKVIGYGIKGVLWYQGEANALYPDGYEVLFSTLIDDWRKQWNLPEMPFAFAQLSAYTIKSDTTNVLWAKLRDAQFNVWQKIKNTGMVTTIDVGTLDDIHPKNKKTVGHRFASCFSFLAYQSKEQYSGPVFKEKEIKGDSIVISYSYAGRLKVKGKTLEEFEICGSDMQFVEAEALVCDQKVIVWSDEIKNPAGVRYAWRNNPKRPNLYNSADFPAVPFSSTSEYNP